MKENLITAGPLRLANLQYNQPISIRDGRTDLVQFTGDYRVDAVIRHAISSGKGGSPVERMWIEWRGAKTLAECERDKDSWRSLRIRTELETLSLLATKAIREALDTVRLGYPSHEPNDDMQTRRTVGTVARQAMLYMVARGWIEEPFSFELTSYPLACIQVGVGPIQSAKWEANLAQVEVSNLMQLVPA